MECPFAKGVYTILMPENGVNRHWCPHCRDWHEPSPSKPTSISELACFKLKEQYGGEL